MDKDKSGDVIVFGIAFLFLVVGIGFFYHAHQSGINGAIVGLERDMLLPFTLVSHKARHVYVMLGRYDPGSFTFGQVVNQVAFVGGYWRWILAPATLLLAVPTFLYARRIEKYRRVFDMHSLLGARARTVASIAPVANRERPIFFEPMDEGPWRTARTHLQFALENKLILESGKPVDPKLFLVGGNGRWNQKSPLWRKGGERRRAEMRFARQRATRIFENQLGGPYKGMLAMPPEYKGLCAAFLLCGHGEKRAGKEFLARMSWSFDEAEIGNPDGMIDIDGADEIIRTYAKSADAAFFTATHTAFLHPYMMAMLRFAHEKDMIPPSLYLWLRPCNRTLWYTLHQVGGRMPWIEAAGPWAHYAAENILEQPLSTPEIRAAVAGLESDLMDQGLFLPLEK